MQKQILLIITIIILTVNIQGQKSDRYIPIENKYYQYIEYQALKSDSIPVFMLTQPYKFSDLEKLDNSRHSSKYHENYIRPGFGLVPDKKFSVDISPGLMGYADEDYQEISKAVSLDGTISIKNLTLVNRIKLDPSVKYDPDFHGDTGEWLMGYLENSYLNFNINNHTDIFAGRVGRNFGIINDYGLILSNNPYNFDHFGLSAGWKSLQYSFYFTRLNDMQGVDSDGGLIPIGETANCHRYWSIQRLDWAILPDLQVALSEATIYGGPNQDFVASYLSPVNFFYASQRNQGYQMSGLWQLAAFYRPYKGIGLYLDLFADDLIANNEPIDDSGTMPREVYPDRLGINAKLSWADLLVERSIISLRYVKIWNDTYISRRNFENYIYFNKSLGYPFNSYEGLKLAFDKFVYPGSMAGLEIEIWRHGDRELTDIYQKKKYKFPVGKVTNGLDFDIFARTILFDNFEIKLDYTASLRNGKLLDPDKVYHKLDARIYYHFMRGF